MSRGNGQGATKKMTLKEEWDRLDSETRQWSLNNPGCVVVPRTVSAKNKENAAGPIEVVSSATCCLPARTSISSAAKELLWGQEKQPTTLFLCRY